MSSLLFLKKGQKYVNILLIDLDSGLVWYKAILKYYISRSGHLVNVLALSKLNGLRCTSVHLYRNMGTATVPMEWKRVLPHWHCGVAGGCVPAHDHLGVSSTQAGVAADSLSSPDLPSIRPWTQPMAELNERYSSLRTDQNMCETVFAGQY